MIRRTLLVLAFLSCVEPLHAQEIALEPADSVRSSSRLELLFGLGGGGGGLALAHGPVVHTSAGLVALRLNAVGAFIGEGRVLGDFSLLYGVERSTSEVWMTAAVGPALAWRIRRSCRESGSWGFCQRYDSESAAAAGLVLQGTIGTGSLGVGVHGNLNRLESFLAVTVNAHVGR